MSSPADRPADVGLLSPVAAGTRAEALSGDHTFVAAMLRAEAALVRALVSTGLAPAAAATVADGIDAFDVDVRRLALAATEGGNPVIPLVRGLRAQAPPALADWVHHGATSQDIVDTALMLVARDVAGQIDADLTRLAGILARLTDQHRAVPVVARTLTQQALPITLGLRISIWLAGVHDAIRTLRPCLSLPSSLGGPVGSAAAYGLDGPRVAEAFAAELGLRAPVSPWHGRRTPVVGLATALTITGEACGKIANDLLVMSQTEIGEAREGGRGPSSAMPHKSNPTQSVLVSAAARQLPGLLSTVTASAAPEQERPAGGWHAEWQPVRTMLRLAGGSCEHTADLVSQVRFDHDALRRNLDRLVIALGKDEAWVDAHTAHAGIWIDRVLRQHQEVLG